MRPPTASLKKRGVDLRVEGLAREALEAHALAVRTMALEVVVPLLEQERNPPDLVLDQDDLEAREAVQYAPKDQVVERVHRLDELLVDALAFLLQRAVREWHVAERAAACCSRGR
jgi:hypothetical protein